MINWLPNKLGRRPAATGAVVTAITINRKYKSIEHYYGCEGTETLTNLTDLERKFDEIVNIRQRLDRLSQFNPYRSFENHNARSW
jgi:hypothetical protein